MRKDSVTAQVERNSGMALRAEIKFLFSLGRGLYSPTIHNRIKCLEGYIAATAKRIEWGSLDKWAIVTEARRQLRLEYEKLDDLRPKFK